MKRLFIFKFCFIFLLLYIATPAFSAKKTKKRALPSKEIQNFRRRVPVLKEHIGDCLAILKKAKRDEDEARVYMEEVLSWFTHRRDSHKDPLKENTRNELEEKIRRSEDSFGRASRKFYAVKQDYHDFKKQYEKQRDYYLDLRKESPMVAKAGKDMKWIQGKIVLVEKTLTEYRKKFESLQEKQSKIKNYCKQQGINYPAPTPSPVQTP